MARLLPRIGVVALLVSEHRILAEQMPQPINNLAELILPIINFNLN